MGHAARGLAGRQAAVFDERHDKPRATRPFRSRRLKPGRSSPSNDAPAAENQPDVGGSADAGRAWAGERIDGKGHTVAQRSAPRKLRPPGLARACLHRVHLGHAHEAALVAEPIDGPTYQWAANVAQSRSAY